MTRPVPNQLRYVVIVGSSLMLVLAAGYVLRQPWATATWPWPQGRLAHIFVGSILAAMAAASLWIALSAEWGATAAGAFNLVVMQSGMAAYLLRLYGRLDRERLLVSAIVCAGFALFNVGLFLWSRRYPIRDPRPAPRPVRISFLVFTLVLLGAGTALVLGVDNVMPWPLRPESGVMFGWIFIGDACYFLYALLRPRWHNATAQLWSFLVYDLVLLPPLLAHFREVRPEHRTSLVIYVAVLLYSGALAVYYLFLNPATRHTLPALPGPALRRPAP